MIAHTALLLSALAAASVGLGGSAGHGDPAARPAVSYALQFSAQPSAVVAPATFAVTVTVINTMTGLPEAPVPSFSITLGTQGVGTLLGTTTLLATTAATTFPGLAYDGLEVAALTAQATGVTGAVSAPIAFDRPSPQVSFPPTAPVNGAFDLPVTFKSMLVPANTVNVTNLPLSVVRRGGSGRLTNEGTYVVSGTGFTVQKLSYDAWESLRLDVSTGFAVSKGAIQTYVTLTAKTPTLFVVPSTPHALELTIRDGVGSPFRATRTFDWAVLSGVTPVHQGTVGTSDSAIVIVNVPGLAAGSYQFAAVPTQGLAVPFLLPIETQTDFPGPVLNLRPARVGTPYAETLSGVVAGTPTSYTIHAGSLPPGLSLDAVTGNITGTPTVAGTTRFGAVGSAGAVHRPMRCTINVFSGTESEWVAGQNFGFTGATPPYTSTSVSQTVAPGSTFDNGNPSFSMQVFYPTQVASITTPMPLLVLHHGRGFNHTEYTDVLGRIARWGFVCVSSGDYYSFTGFSNPGYAGPQPYETPTQYAEGGMESASGIQERLIRRMIIRNRTVGDPLFGKIDESRLFIAGHSRGGGAVHAGQSRGFNFKLLTSAPQIPVTETTGIAGYIGLMPYDLWSFTSCQPPSIPAVPAGIGATPYNIAKNLRRIPGLVFASELDGDLIYPICDQMAERRSTSTCFLTIWGGNHNNTGDSHAADATSSITALTQRNILVQWMTAFLLRYGYDRLDLEGHLFGPEHAQSTHVGRVAFRDVSAPIMVLDGQNGNPALNSLSLPNVASAGITTALSDPYPALGGVALPNATPRSLRFLFSTTGAGKTWTTTVSNTGLDVTKKRRLVFEIRQSGTIGFSWISIGVRLTDISSASTLVTVYDRIPSPDVSAYLPIYPIAGHSSTRPLNRFVQVEIDLSQFSGVNLAQLANIRLEFDNSITGANLMIDDLRIE